MSDGLKIPNFDHDDTAFVVKEVTVLSGFIAAVAKLWSIFRKEDKVKRISLKERQDRMEADISELQTAAKETKQDYGAVVNGLSQILNELSGIRADSRQTRTALDNTQKVVNEILMMKRQEQSGKEERSGRG